MVSLGWKLRMDMAQGNSAAAKQALREARLMGHQSANLKGIGGLTASSMIRPGATAEITNGFFCSKSITAITTRSCVTFRTGFMSKASIEAVSGSVARQRAGLK